MSDVYSVERWGCLELRFLGNYFENPFIDATIKGKFEGKHETIDVEGFYDGNNTYKVRFMPSFIGDYKFEVEGNFSDVVYTGNIKVYDAKMGNHGPVKVADKFHFTYSDGTPYYSIGTTCYAWLHQPKEMREQTIKTLSASPFNKIRFCIFPKHYDYNLYEPVTYPYEGKPCDISNLNRENFKEYVPTNPDNDWDFTRFNVKHFQILERNIEELLNLGIEADVILFHPYDRWGFSCMEKEDNLRYMRYVIARLAAYRNVWWSLANEFDLCQYKTTDDWEAIAETIVRYDPYVRLRSIHNCRKMYDYTRPWITHCSIQRTEIYLSATNTHVWRDRYEKPVVLDEVGYEGNINHNWGNLMAEDMVKLFWYATVRGGYCGHGETYVHEYDKLWWSHGSVLHGESAPRLAFLKKILDEVPGLGLQISTLPKWDNNLATAAHLNYTDKFYIFYIGDNQPSFKDFCFNDDKRYKVEVIDTWNMTIEERGIYSGKFYIDLPSRKYMAIRITEI